MNEARSTAGFPPVLPSKTILKIVERIEGKESAERLEYSTQESANMMMEKLVKSSVDGQGAFSQAVIQMADAIATMSEQQNEMVKVLANLADRLEIKGEGK